MEFQNKKFLLSFTSSRISTLEWDDKFQIESMAPICTDSFVVSFWDLEEIRSCCKEKDGFTVDERATKEPERLECMQRTDAACSRCKKKQVGVPDIVHAGESGDRYQVALALVPISSHICLTYF